MEKEHLNSKENNASEKAGSEKAGSKKAGSEKVSSEQTDSGKIDSEKVNNKESNGKKTSSKKAGRGKSSDAKSKPDRVKTVVEKASLSTLTEQWKSLERKTLEQRKKAESFYETKLMTPITEDFIERNKGKVWEEADYLILSVGTSYEPLILSISLLKPKHILFLHTKLSNLYLDKVISYCGLAPSEYVKREVSETDPISTYKEIKDMYICWGKPEKIFIDITGGTKTMSAAAALVGAMIKVQLLYIGTNHYLADFRAPDPGSETLFCISNPLEVFGDLEIEKAFALFEKNNYAGTRERLEELKGNIPSPNLRQQLNFIFCLASAYEKWDALDFCGAYGSMQELNSEIERDRQFSTNFVLMNQEEKLREQERILQPLNEIPGMLKEKRQKEILSDNHYMIPLMFTMYQDAKVRESQEKLDMATLLLYRLLEMIEQKRLSEYGFYVSQMDYYNFHMPRRNQDWNDLSSADRLSRLKTRYSATKLRLFGKCNNNYMPDQIALLEGFIILFCLDDEIVTAAGEKAELAIHRLQRLWPRPADGIAATLMISSCWVREKIRRRI